jgi:broad specificity phosphatase PhoE
VTAAVLGRARGPRLHLVRHGESVWNAVGLLQGRNPAVPLTERGLAQARDVALRLRREPVVAVYSSDQLRCMQTAELIAAWHGLPVRRETALREQCHGVWQGRPSARYAPVLAAADPDWAPPGGESARALLRRVSAFVAVLDRIAWPPGGDVVVVTHGETLRALVAALADRPVERMTRLLPGNGEIRTVEDALRRSRPAGLAG